MAVMERLLTAPEAAKWVGVSTPTLLRIAHRKEIRHLRIGKQFKFRKSDIDEYLKKAER